MKVKTLAALTAALVLGTAGIALAQSKTLEPGKETNMVLLPKFLGILPFDQAHRGAQEAHEELEKRFSNRAHTVDGTPGFLGFQLLRPVRGDDRYFVVTHWADEESFAAWRDGDAIKAHAGERANPVSSGADLLEFEVVLDVRPS